ncbi:hypothetical protein R5R35_005379 [Gryllus longicercus]|uniref:Mitotic spindle assembly checkpoint protein MAD1 n=1 Tax=Gryllus longicercus TaxID=2509291 RepID=A0AAN9Z0Z5_9ORTH
MASYSEDRSYVIQMLEDLRSVPQRRVSRLLSSNFNEPVDNLKRKKSTENIADDSPKFPKLENVTPKTTPDPEERSNRCSSPTASPWETYRIRSSLLEANIKITDLENQISRHHSLRQELESLFEKEKDSLLKQVDREKTMVKELENHLQVVRKREVEVKEELKQCRTALNRDKTNFEERFQTLQVENGKLTDSLRELEESLRSERLTTARLIQRLNEDLSERDQQLIDIKNRNSELEKKLQEGLLFQSQFEQLSQELKNAQIKIKELEKERDDYHEAAELVKSKQEKVFRYSELEKEVQVLREENSNLKIAIPKHLLLEEMVEDLKSRQALSEEQTHDLAWSQGRLNQVQTMLDDWNKVAKDYCEGYMSSSHPPDPAIIRKRFNELQQRVHVLTADLSDVKSQLNDTQQRKDLLTIELQSVKKEKEKYQNLNEELNSRLRLLQKKHQLVSAERNSYRSQLDSYEKDLTISLSSVANQQNHQLQQRLDTMERILEGYRKMMKEMESESDRTKGFAGNSDIMEKLNRLEGERNTLLQEKEQLQKRKDELEVQLEYRAIKGDFNPVTSKVLHFRMNPASEAEAQYEDEIVKLRSKCSRLEERIKLLEAGNVHDITQKVEENVASSNSQEVQGLQEVINAQEIKMQRLKEVFHASAKEFREVCYELFGYKIDRNENIYKLSSMYADSPDDHLMFKRIPDGTIDMMETPYSSTLGELIDLHLHQHNSPPLFLGAVTLELFNRQTLSQTISQTIELN